MSEKTIDSTPRVALVTGAAQGIGQAIALRLAEDGLDVAVLDLPQKREQLEAVVDAIKAKGRGALAIFADVSSEAEVEAAIQETVDKLGALDVVVANAATVEVMPIVDLTVESWDKTVAVNARGVMLAIKHGARRMIAQGRGGRIIAASSVAGKRGLLHVPAYSATKFAVRGLVQSAAVELRAHNITVNGYCPGIITTEMTSFPDDEANGGHGTTLRAHFGIPPDIKPGTPDVVASYVSYIAKPESHYISGQCVTIDGGWIMD
ncbi:NAD-P-binding protein [Trametes sanguinea]|nr:NAD-P-binding protein [Trametes sanguinea]